MRGQAHGHSVPGDLQVGVMTHLLRRLDHAGDELHRADEVGALELLRDRVAAALPTGKLGQPLLDLGIAQQRHRTYPLKTTKEAQMSDTSPTLWHIGISHYNEKARWALDHKG